MAAGLPRLGRLSKSPASMAAWILFSATIWMTRSVSMVGSCRLSAVSQRELGGNRTAGAGFGDAFDVFEVVVETLAQALAHHEVAEGGHDFGHQREWSGVNVERDVSAVGARREGERCLKVAAAGFAADD